MALFQNSAVYAKELESEPGHLLGLYDLVLWKSYPKKKSTWEPAAAIQHLKKMISSFYKDHSNKPTATSLAIDTAPLIAWPAVKPTSKPSPKKKRCRPAKTGANKKGKN